MSEPKMPRDFTEPLKFIEIKLWKPGLPSELVFYTCVLGRPEIAVFWGLGGPGGAIFNLTALLV